MYIKSQADIEMTRACFYDLASETSQTQMLLDYMIQHSSCGSSIMYAVAGKPVCEKCWRLTYGLRYNKFAVLKQRFADGIVSEEHGRQGEIMPRDFTIRAVSWMRTFFEKVGDRMLMSESIHLPSCLTKADVYCLAYDDLTSGGTESCSLTTFYRVRANNFPHVQIPKLHMFVQIPPT